MKRSTFTALAILTLAVIVATTSTSAAIVAEHGPSASGAGQFTFLNPQQHTEVWSFSFDATANKNGNTHGRAQFDNLTAQTQVVVRIDCLSVTAGVGRNFATFSGRVLHSDDPNLPKLERVIFAASEGLLSTSGPDTITPLFLFPPFEGVEDCHDTQPLTILPVEGGDIDIQP